MAYSNIDVMKTEDKIYIDVLEERTKDGRLIPRSFRWTDGRRYEIDRVKEIVRAASLIAGGVGIRYTVVIRGHERYMFLEDDARCRWFVEAKNG